MLEPQKHTFDTIWGHDAARAVVPRLLATGRLPHALLLTGVDAIGKRSLAFAMAKAILSAGRPIQATSLDAPGAAPAKRDVPEEDEGDLFGDAPDLFGGEEVEQDLFGNAESPAAAAPPEPEPPPAAPEPEPEKPRKTRAKKKVEEAAAAPAASPAPAPAVEPETARLPPRAVFQGFDARVCRLVEASYPVTHDKDGRPSNGAHFDLTIVEPIGQRRNILVDQVRHLQEIGSLPPVEGLFRVVLVFGADSITAEGGNSILKLLEEPPRYLVMILVADRLSAVLPTIRSRCTILPMSPLSRDVLVSKLIEEEKLEVELAKVAAALSEGRPGAALQAIQASLLERRREVFQARLQLDRYGAPAVAQAASRIQSAGNLEQVLWLLLSFTRDRLVRATVPDRPELLVHGDAIDLLDGGRHSAEYLDGEADRILRAYEMLAHPFLPNARAALQLVLWPE